MQNFDFNGNFSKKSRLALAVSAVVLTLVGCGHSDKKASKDTTSESGSADKKAEKLDCSSPTVASAIQQATINQISQQATTNVQQLAQQAGIANTNIDLSNLVGQMNVAVANPSAIAEQADQCQANIAVTLPDSLINKASQIATSLNQTPLAQNLASKGLNLEKNTITAINASFKVTPSGDSYKATPSNGSSTSSILMTEVGNLIGNAQLAQIIGTGGATPSLEPASTPDKTISNEPTSASSNANAISNEPTTSQAQPTTPSVAPVIVSPAPSVKTTTQQSEKPVVVKKTTTTTTQSDKPKTTVVKKVETATTQEAEKQTDDKKVVKTTTTTTKTIKDVSEEKSTVKKDTADNKLGSAVKKSPIATGPAAKPTQKADSDDEVKLTIEEKNEKY